MWIILQQGWVINQSQKAGKEKAVSPMAALEELQGKDAEKLVVPSKNLDLMKDTH